MFGPSPPFRLSRFSDPEFLQGLHPTRPGPRGASPRGTRLSPEEATEPQTRRWSPENGPRRKVRVRVRVRVPPTPPGRRVSGPGVARKSPWSLAVTVTDNRSKGRWGSAHPTSETCFWAWRRSKKPLELSFHCYRQTERRVSGPGVARKSPWSLAVTVTRTGPRGAGAVPTRQEACLWAWRRSKKPLELRFLSAQNLSPQNHTFNHFRRHLKPASLTDPPPGSRSNPEPTGDEAPSRPASAPQTPWMFGPSPVFDLVVFEPKFIQGPLPAAVPRAAPGREGRKRPEATVPPLVTPKTLSRWHLKTASPNGPTSGPRARPEPTSRVPGGTLRVRPTEPRLRPEGGNRAHPLYPPQGTRTSGRGGRLSYTHSTRLREPGPRAEGATLLHPSTASGNQDLGQRGHSPAPLYPPREPGPRAEGAPSCTPSTRLELSPPGRLSSEGPLTSRRDPYPPTNHDSGLRGNRAHPLYRLREPGPRAEGRLSYTHSTASGNQDLGQRGHSPAPLYPTQGTRTSGRGATLTPTLPASGNQDLGQRGHSPAPLYPPREPGPRAEGAPSHPFYPPRTLSSPAASPPRAPPDLQEGPLPRPPFEPGHPTLKPGLLTRHPRLRRTRPLGTPGEILPLVTPHRLRFWPPLPRTSRVPGGLCEPDPRNHDSGPRGGTAHTRRHWFPPYRLRFFRRHPPGHWYPRDTAGGRTEAARVGLLLGRQKIGSREDFQWIAASELLCHARNPDPESGRSRVI
ncbi:hypothetical protein G5714_005197 [Onychostoma macrolepis]|uniref:Uncharacterized protein n=1 Tax=Onychostoma macrolepis TaxID=369639 RepID=A0A7J6D7J4_9TELE|nr:hypothetical protein G5714_005197 [Onychostoma macrolepis]